MFAIENNKLVLDADLMASVADFKIIWDRDDREDKAHAMAFFKFIYHTNNPRSPFHGYPADRRAEYVVEQEFPEDLKKWDYYRDRDVIVASDKYYKFLRLAPERALLDAAESVLHETADKLNKKTTKGKENLVEKMSSNMKRVVELRSMVAQEEEKLKQDGKSRRSAREDPDYKPMYVPKGKVLRQITKP